MAAHQPKQLHKPFFGRSSPHALGNLTLTAFGAGSGFLGLRLPVLSGSFFTKQQPTGFETVLQCFHILNNSDIPIGIEHPVGKSPDIPSATRWTSAIDLTNRKIYYKTTYNSTIRCIDLKNIDFNTVRYQSFPLDKTRQ